MTKSWVASVTLAAVVLAWASAGGAPAQAHTPHPGLKFSIAVNGVLGCDTTAGDKTCTITSGSTFTVNVALGPLPSDIPNYDGFDIVMTYAGLEAQGQPSMNAWPDCAFPAFGQPTAGSLGFGCAVGLPPAQSSTHVGTIATVQFKCSQSGNVVLHNGDGDTDLVPPATGPNVAGVHAMGLLTETISVICGSVPGGVQGVVSTPQPGTGTTPGAASATRLPPTEAARATATAQARITPVTTTATPNNGTGQGAGDGGGGVGGGVIAIIVVAAVVVAGGAGFFGWRYWQSQRGAGGGT